MLFINQYIISTIQHYNDIHHQTINMTLATDKQHL